MDPQIFHHIKDERFLDKVFLDKIDLRSSGPLGPPTLKNDFIEVSNLVNNNFREILTLRI